MEADCVWELIAKSFSFPSYFIPSSPRYIPILEREATD
jgi:hypothetical protein